jgi:hypothetical protein
MAITKVTTSVLEDGSVHNVKIADNAVDAAKLNISGNGTAGQALLSDGDGTFSWGQAGIEGVNSSNGIYGTVTNGILNISMGSDLRGNVELIGVDNNGFYYVSHTNHGWFLDGNLDMQLQDNGNLQVDGDVIAYSATTSDRRLKDNIKTIDNALEKVERLRGVEYDWNKGSRKGQHEIGLIAQEVEEVFPFLVHEHELATGDFENDNTVYKTVDYEKLIGVLIESVKELSEKVKTLESKLQ